LHSAAAPQPKWRADRSRQTVTGRGRAPLQHALAHDLPPPVPSAASVLARFPSFVQFASPGERTRTEEEGGESGQTGASESVLSEATRLGFTRSRLALQNLRPLGVGQITSIDVAKTDGRADKLLSGRSPLR
jgi:hypothetical protein